MHVDTSVAASAINKLFHAASASCVSCRAAPYHRSENPCQMVNRELLTLNTASTSSGR